MPEIAEMRSLVVGRNFYTAVEASPAGPGPAQFQGEKDLSNRWLIDSR